jgi:hypothetical protein
MSKDKFDEYCKMAHLVAKDRIKKHAWKLSSVHLSPNSPESRKWEEDGKQIYEFLKKNSKRPYEYNWSGGVILNVLRYLKEQKGMDLMKNMFYQDGDPLYVFDKELKDEFLRKLDPSKFSEEELKYFCQHYDRELEDLVKQDIRSSGSRKPLRNDFPEAGNAMMDGIRIIHDYLKLIDDKCVVMLYIA